MRKNSLLSSRRARTLIQKTKGAGYSQISKLQLQKDEDSLGLEPPRKQEGLKKQFSFQLSGSPLEARVNTSILIGGYTFSENAPFGMLRRRGVRVLTLPSLHRTKNFIQNFLGMSEILKSAVTYHPLCPDCRAWMDIEEVCDKNDRMVSVRWVCNKIRQHKSRKPVFFDFIQLFKKQLSDVAMNYWNEMMRKRKVYRENIETKKKKPRNIRHIRKEWSIEKPNNVLT
ncbi:hypothetical protein KC866_04050 [Patescibacteria group bacterium]|nr:hypothetical protein [Patescibacteria group bacterium]